MQTIAYSCVSNRTTPVCSTSTILLPQISESDNDAEHNVPTKAVTKSHSLNTHNKKTLPSTQDMRQLQEESTFKKDNIPMTTML